MKRDAETRRRGDAEKREESLRQHLSSRPFTASPRLRVLYFILHPSSLILALVLLYGVIYPNLHVLTASLQANGGWSLANYRDALSHSTTLEAAVSSVVLSLLTVALCAIVGASLAFLFERYTFPARGLFATLAALPLVLPPLVGTIAFIFLFGESGILARFVQWLFGLKSAPWTLRGWTALLIF